MKKHRAPRKVWILFDVEDGQPVVVYSTMTEAKKAPPSKRRAVAGPYVLVERVREK